MKECFLCLKSFLQNEVGGGWLLMLTLFAEHYFSPQKLLSLLLQEEKLRRIFLLSFQTTKYSPKQPKSPPPVRQFAAQLFHFQNPILCWLFKHKKTSTQKNRHTATRRKDKHGHIQAPLYPGSYRQLKQFSTNTAQCSIFHSIQCTAVMHPIPPIRPLIAQKLVYFQVLTCNWISFPFSTDSKPRLSCNSPQTAFSSFILIKYQITTWNFCRLSVQGNSLSL